MRRETELFFYQLVRENRSVLDLFSADYTYVNEIAREALRHSGRDRPEFRRVDLSRRPSPRAARARRAC